MFLLVHGHLMSVSKEIELYTFSYYKYFTMLLLMKFIDIIPTST